MTTKCEIVGGPCLFSSARNWKATKTSAARARPDSQSVDDWTRQNIKPSRHGLKGAEQCHLPWKGSKSAQLHWICSFVGAQTQITISTVKHVYHLFSCHAFESLRTSNCNSPSVRCCYLSHTIYSHTHTHIYIYIYILFVASHYTTSVLPALLAIHRGISQPPWNRARFL
jgi:hypothetical protein